MFSLSKNASSRALVREQSKSLLSFTKLASKAVQMVRRALGRREFHCVRERDAFLRRAEAERHRGELSPF